MKLATFEANARVSYGILKDQGVVDVGSRLGDRFPDLRSIIVAEEMTSNGIPFQTAVLPPPRNVGTPDSADTPAPVRTSTRAALAKRRRNSEEICTRRDGNKFGPRMNADGHGYVILPLFYDIGKSSTKAQRADSLGRAETLARIWNVDPADVPVDEVMNTVTWKGQRAP